jgi:hypothetical protein
MPCARSLRKGVGAWGLLPLEGFGEALQTQVVVPLPGELLVLLVQAGKVNVVAALDSAAPLLDSEIVITEVERLQVGPSAKPSSKHISGSRIRSPFCSP